MAYKIIEIEGVDDSYARKLDDAGIHTTDDLLAEVNEKKNICNRIPSVSELERMIKQAGKLDPVLKY